MKKGLLLLYIAIIATSCTSLKISSEAHLLNAEIIETEESLELTWEISNPQDVKRIEIWGREKFYGHGLKPLERIERLSKHTLTWNYSSINLEEWIYEIRVILRTGQVENSSRLRGFTPHPTVHVEDFGGRRIYMYIPEGLEEGKRYPVAYVQDGQNLFSPSNQSRSEWGIDETLEELMNRGALDPMIVVGIGSKGTRVSDFWPQAMGNPNGKGEVYAQWMVEELLPYIEGKYPVSREKSGRATFGSSYGSPISLYLGFAYPEVFSFVGALSPAMDFGGVEYLMSLEKPDIKLYIDAGELEYYRIIQPGIFDFTGHSRSLVEDFKTKGFIYSEDLFYLEHPRAEDHRESTVALRVQNPLLIFQGDIRAPLKDILVDWSLPNSEKNRETYHSYLNVQAVLENGLWFTLLDLAEYIPESNVQVDANGRVLTTDHKSPVVEVRYQGISQRAKYHS
jgi:enterochelin esterase-like enzyme